MNFIHKWLNPHCPHCREDRIEKSVCQSCEILRVEIERLRYENERLLQTLLDKTKPETTPVYSEKELKPILPRAMPWSARRQMLENESRNTAKILHRESMRNETKPSPEDDVELRELETELGIAGEKREAEATISQGTNTVASPG